jgi:hypothetical protein
MSSAGEELVVNPLERALSGDIMRLQNFQQKYLSEMLRALIDTGTGTDDTAAGAYALQNVTQGNPAHAEVLSGLLFTPGVGVASSVVGPGWVSMFDPDAVPSTDDSQYKSLLDPGTTSTLTPSIALTPNSSGLIRIDVLECARVQPDNIIETDSRDVFNTVTGTFAAASVNKVTQGQLQYRIRLGTPGAGFPGTALGWMPIAVMSVPTGTTVWDTVTVWDVRPLIGDRVYTPWKTTRALPNYVRLDFSTNTATAGQYRVNGCVDVAAPLGERRLGGWLERGSPGTDFAGYVDLYDPANQESGYSFPAGLSYIYLVTMFGLPRWARYTDASFSIRQPRSPRGILVVSATPPIHWTGGQSAGIQLPAVYGFGSAVSTAGVCIGAVVQTSGSTFSSLLSSNKAQMTAAPGPSYISVNANSGFSGGVITFTLKENIHFPAGAKRIKCAVAFDMTIPGTNQVFQQVSFSLENTLDASGLDGWFGTSDLVFFYNPSGSPATDNALFQTDWMPLQTGYPLLSAAQHYTLTAQVSSIDASVTPVCQILGWEF